MAHAVRRAGHATTGQAHADSGVGALEQRAAVRAAHGRQGLADEVEDSATLLDNSGEAATGNVQNLRKKEHFFYLANENSKLNIL